MKKLLIVLFVVGLSLPSFAGLKEKDVIGKWTYKVEAGDENLSGKLQIEKKEGKLTGTIYADSGESLPMNKVEIKDDNTLYFEVQPDYDVIKISVTIDGKKYQGTVDVNGETMPITGEKVE